MQSATPSSPAVLSIVVTVVDGGIALRELLEVLGEQESADGLEIIVPYDTTIKDVGSLEPTFPSVRFLPLGRLALRHDWRSGAGQHELFDLRRAAGLSAATAPLIGMIEDRALPERTWVATMRALHAQFPHLVIGGPIGTTARDTLNWAFYACDFTRYAPPLEPGPREFVSDVNLCYKREALALTREIWSETYNEAKVHWALAARGEALYLNDAPVVWHCSRYERLWPLVKERFDWGRLFGAARALHDSVSRRVLLVAASPFVVPMLWARLARVHMAKPDSRLRFVRASPVVLALQAAWIAGEAWGVVSGRT